MLKKISFMRPAAFGAMLLLAGHAYAIGEGKIVSGNGFIQKLGGGSQAVRQLGDKMIINWSDMNIGKQEALVFMQNSDKAVALNRVDSFKGATRIDGMLSSNGRVIVVNPAGVVFGNGARVNVGGLIASSLDISNEDFNKGKLNFSGTGAGAVYNGGKIESDGMVALLGPTVTNEGAIHSKDGDIALLASDAVELKKVGGHVNEVDMNKSSDRALVLNSGQIRTSNGNIKLVAYARDSLARDLINNTGSLEADGLDQLGGISMIAFGKGNIRLGGTIDASGKTSVIGALGMADIHLDGTMKTRGSAVLEAGNVIATEYAAGAGNTDIRRHEIAAGQGLIVDAYDTAMLGDVSGSYVGILSRGGAVELGQLNTQGWGIVAAQKGVNIGGANTGDALMIKTAGDVRYGSDLNAGGAVVIDAASVKAARDFAGQYARINSDQGVSVLASSGDIQLGDVSAGSISVNASRGSVSTQAMNSETTLAISASKDLTYAGNLAANGNVSLSGANVSAGVVTDAAEPNFGKRADITSYFGNVAVKATQKVALGGISGALIDVADRDGKVSPPWQTADSRTM